MDLRDLRTINPHSLARRSRDPGIHPETCDRYTLSMRRVTPPKARYNMRKHWERTIMRLSIATAFWLLPVLALRADPNDSAQVSKPHPFVQQAIGWFPVDIETVIVSQGSFDFDVAFNQSEPNAAFHALPLTLLSEVRKGMLRHQLRGKKVAFAVEGSRRFRSPKGLGTMPYDGCEIVRFDEASGDAAKEAFRTCLHRADAKEEIAGNTVAVLNEKWEEDEWTLLFAQPLPQTLLCATDRKFLEQIFNRMAGKGEGRALPENLGEWGQANVSAPVWGVRHYPQDKVGDDRPPTLAAGAPDGFDEQAIGFVFWYDPQSSDPLRARYLSGRADAKQVAKWWQEPGQGLSPTVTVVSPGVVEISGKAGAKDRWDLFLLVAQFHLGHGVMF